jgi:hypothetical protein
MESDDLDHAEQAMSVHEQTLQAPSLSEAERQAMRQFCLQSLRLKQQQDSFKEQRKQLASNVKENRAKLQEWMRAQGSKCFVMPRAVFKEAEGELSGGGLPAVPPYLRMQRNTSDAAITPAVAESCIMDLDEQSVLERIESGTPPLEALAKAIVDAARNSVRSVKEAVALSESIEKGTKPMEVEEVPPEIARLMVDMHKAQQQSKAKSTVQREATSDVNSTIKRLQPTVASVLDKTGRNSQQVTLDGVQGNHRIVKRVSARAPKVTLSVFEEAVEKTLRSVPIDASNGGTLLQSFRSVRKQVVKGVQLKLNGLPKKESVKVSLVSSKQEEDASEGEEET